MKIENYNLFRQFLMSIPADVEALSRPGELLLNYFQRKVGSTVSLQETTEAQQDVSNSEFLSEKMRASNN